MLMVVFGAGASFDSYPDDIWNGRVHPDFRPPLAAELFDARQHFIETIREFPQCQGILARLRDASTSGLALEDVLQQFLVEAESGDITRARQLAAIRFYLQKILFTCSEHWHSMLGGGTNYADLLDRLRVWANHENEEVLLMTFNYDTLLEKAAVSTLGFSFASLADYIPTNSRFRIFKLHGSVSWGRAARPVRNRGGAEKNEMIDAVTALTITNDFHVMPSPDHLHTTGARDEALFPAIAIPVRSKNNFECPQTHLNLLVEEMPKVTRLLVIGWRGAEENFLQLWTTLAQGNIRIHTVTGGPTAQEDALNLNPKLNYSNVTVSKLENFAGGFSHYMRSNSLEELLS